MFYKTMFYW